MKTTKLHTFEDVLTKGITIDNQNGEETLVKVSCIFIPKIQRSYAQGRISEGDIRSDFLKEIFSTLTTQCDTTLELSFLFGSKQALINGSGEGFELLDGQQRTTTLFLLYWYIYNRESEILPEFLRKFTYETRDTSTQFLCKITSTRFDLSDKKPSRIIKANKWFTDDFNCDATICAMLNMLDDIHDMYCQKECSGLLDKLSRLKFYVLLLEEFDMNDELYIKMNSRGLSLTPFENFKASLVKYMKAPKREGLYGSDDTIEGEAPYWLKFITNLDAKWIDIFWQNETYDDSQAPVNEFIKIDDKEIGNKYFRFLIRYFFTKAAILKGIERSGSKRYLSPLPNFFYNDAEDNVETRLKGWNYFEQLFDLLAEEQKGCSFPVFGNIERILDTFHSHYDSICAAINEYTYGCAKEFDVRKPKDKFQITHRAIFAGITEFIEAIPEEKSFANDIVQANFRRMLRVVQNIIENTPIESGVPLVSVINAIREIINLPGAVDRNFYESLAKASLKSDNKQLAEEQEKAQQMFSSGEFDESWEEAFKTAEKHSFLKGAVRFFFTPNHGNSKDFLDRYNIINELFDKDGITPAYRKDKGHILIRAILSCLNEWNPVGSQRIGMENRYITENAETQKYLKNILLGSSDVRNMFCQYFDNRIVSIDEYLEQVVHNAVCQDNGNEQFRMLYQRLINDSCAPYIFDWIEDREKVQNSRFKIHNNRRYIVAIPGTWYDRIVLDTERHIFIPKIVNKYGFDYCDNNQKKSINGPMKDSWGWSISIEKKIVGVSGKYTLSITFNEGLWVDFFVYGDNPNTIISQWNLASDRIVSGGGKVEVMTYLLDKDIQPIMDKIDELEKIIQNL